MTNDVSSSSRSCSGEEEPVSSSRTRVLFRRHLSRPVQTGGLGLSENTSTTAFQFQWLVPVVFNLRLEL